MYNKKGFTLIELTISILILGIITLGITLALVKVGNNINQNSIKTDIFADIKEFNYDSYLFNYSSGKILSGALLLYNELEGILVGSFLDNNGGFDYTINSNDLVYKKNYFGYFKIKSNTLSGILNETIDLQNEKFNNGKIFKQIIFKDFLIRTLNNGTLFEIDVKIFYNFSSEYINKNKSDIFIPDSEYLKFNFNF